MPVVNTNATMNEKIFYNLFTVFSFEDGTLSSVVLSKTFQKNDEALVLSVSSFLLFAFNWKCPHASPSKLAALESALMPCGPRGPGFTQLHEVGKGGASLQAPASRQS